MGIRNLTIQNPESFEIRTKVNTKVDVAKVLLVKLLNKGTRIFTSNTLLIPEPTVICIHTIQLILESHQVVIAQWLAKRLANGEVPGTNLDQGENLIISG